jgi:hypothetical protein
MPVQLKVQLVSVADDGSESTEDLLVLTKEHERLEQVLDLSTVPGVENVALAPSQGRKRPRRPPDEEGETP